MKQAALGLNLSRKRTRKREFLEEMQRVVPWSDLIALIEPHYPKARTGRPPMGIDVMLSQRPSRRKISGESRHRQRVHRGFIGIAVPDALIRRSLGSVGTQMADPVARVDESGDEVIDPFRSPLVWCGVPSNGMVSIQIGRAH